MGDCGGRDGVGGAGPRSASNKKQRLKSLKWRAVTAQRSLPLRCDVMRTSCRHPAGGGGGGAKCTSCESHPTPTPAHPSVAWHSRERERESVCQTGSGGWRSGWRGAICGGGCAAATTSRQRPAVGQNLLTTSKGRRSDPPWPTLVPPPTPGPAP